MSNRIQKINDFEKSSTKYFKEITKYNPLSKNEEKSLWERYKLHNDLNAKEMLIKHNLRFVAAVARSYQGLGLSYADLIAEGNIGLLKSIDKFDYTKGYKTISYAVWWIKQTILEALRSRNLIDADNIQEYHDSDVDNDDENCQTDNDSCLLSNNYIDNSTMDFISHKDDKSLVNLLCKCLTEREFFVIKHYFGLDNADEMTLESIGETIGLTKERVRQIKERALKKLRSEAIEQNVV